MSEDDPRKYHRAPGGYRPRADGQPRTNTSKSTANRAGLYQALKAPDAKAAARALFEGTPGATCQSVSIEMKVPVGTVRRWKSEDGWTPAARTILNLPGRAGALADTFKVKMSQLGKPLSDEVAAEEAAKEMSNEFAVDVRANLLDRHRKEWAAPRKLIYEAVQKGDIDKARLAKITGETLQLIQAGECRAYGMTLEARGADSARTVVLIDREAEVPEGRPSALGTDVPDEAA